MTSFITDMGSSMELTSDIGETMRIPRYGVWVYAISRGKFEVAETSDDLDMLQKAYGPGLQVAKLELRILDRGRKL